jgi:heme-degrading monooxygenase HmoA
MAVGAWHQLSTPRPEREYLFLLSFLRLRRFRSMPGFERRARAIAQQLVETEGVIGFSLRSDLLRKRYWTQSVWDDESPLRRFVGADAHLAGLRKIRPLISESEFIRWRDDGNRVPPDWDTALERLEPTD